MNRVASPSPPQRISIRPSIASESTGAGENKIAAEQMAVIMREQEQIAGCDLDLLVCRPRAELCTSRQ